MIKLTLQDYWQPEDDISAIIDKWLSEENAKIPADIRENLRGLFPHIGISPDEADLIPASVAQYITVHSSAYRKYLTGGAQVGGEGGKDRLTVFEQEFFPRLRALYVRLEFYAKFVEVFLHNKQAGILYVDESSIRVSSDLLKAESSPCAKTKMQEQMLTFLTKIEEALSEFESIIPVETLRYIGQTGYKIPEDTVSTYHAAQDMVYLIDLKKQAEELLCKHNLQSFSAQEVKRD